MSFVDTVKQALGMGRPYDAPQSTGLRLRSWRPELPDPRDYLYVPKLGLSRPDQVAPLGSRQRIHDQGMTSSCTGHAGTAMLEIRLSMTGDEGQLSRLFPYYLARELIGETGVDAGAYNRDIIRSMLKHGVPSESYWRFNTTNLLKRPSVRAYHEAELFRQKIESQKFVYERVVGLDQMLDAIATGNPVLFGFLCFDNIFDLTSTKHVYTMPASGMQPVGGHAVVADGYSMSDRTVWVQNSWGTSWGKRGYFKMPFEWFTSPNRLVDDCWTMRSTGPTPAPLPR